MPRLTDNSPGGFFDNIDSSANNSNSANRGTSSDTPASGGGTVNPAVNNSAAQSASDAREYAGDARGWAVGNTTSALNGWSGTNNSMYWSEQARQTYTNTQTLIAGIDTDALRAILAQAVTARQGAESARDQANTAANNAQAQAIVANNSAGEAQTQANRATTSATQAAGSASNAAASASTATTQATNASNSATAAASSAATASSGASQASISATAAGTSATNASNSATTAANAATSAEAQRDQASTFATNAGNSATLAMNWALDTESGSNAYNQNSARYWARQAAASAAANTVYDSDITVSVGTNLTGGGTFSLNQDSDETINIGLGANVVVNAVQSGHTVTLTKQNGTTVQFDLSSGGGGTDPLPANLFTLGASPSTLTFTMSGSNQNVVVSLANVSGFTLTAANTTVHAPNGTVFQTSSSLTGFTMSVPTTTAGRYTITTQGTSTRASDSTTHTTTEVTHVDVDYQWYYSREDTVPTSVGEMDARGVWRGASSTPVTAPGGTAPLYIAVPARTGGYYLADGDTTLVPPRLGTTFDTHWLLYSTNEAVAGTTYQLVEA